MTDDLETRVAREICEAGNVPGFRCACPHRIDGWCLGGRLAVQARAAIAEVRRWDEEQRSRAGDVLTAVRAALPEKTEWTVSSLKERVKTLCPPASPKQIHNALTYLAKRGRIIPTRWGRFEVAVSPLRTTRLD